jgi:tellurium resistance protein TerZ
MDRFLSQLSSVKEDSRIGQTVTVEENLPFAKAGRLRVSVQATFNMRFVFPKERIPVAPCFQIGLAWDLDQKDGHMDLDASLIALDVEEQIVQQVWYCQDVAFEGGIRHSGDDKLRDGNGDDETLSIDTSRLPQTVEKLAVCLNSFSGQAISNVRFAYIRIVADGRTEAVAWLDTSKIPANCTGLFVGTVFRSSMVKDANTVANAEDKDKWQFIPIWAAANGINVFESRGPIIKYGKQHLGW